MSAPPDPPTLESVLDRFLVDAPPHPVELHVIDEVERRSASDTVGDFIVTDVVHGLLDTEPRPETQRRQVRVRWAQPSGVVASVVFSGLDAHHEILRRTLLAARRHRCVVRWMRGGEILQPSVSDIFNVPRTVRQPGKLAPYATITDTPERFDVMFGKINRPGVMAKRVLRRAPVEETWRVVLDAAGLQVGRVRRKDSDDVQVPLADLVAVVKSPWATSLGPRQSILTTTEVIAFPRLSFFGRTFGLNADDAWDFEQFVLDRINQRIGM